MPRSSLFLWAIVEPWTMAFGLIAAAAAYWVVHPRPSTRLGELPIEGWRIYAILTSIPAFLFGAELGLWAVLLDYHAPLYFTGLVDSLGLWLIACVPAPLILAFCQGRRLNGRPALMAVGLLGVGAALGLAGPRLRGRAWSALASSASDDRVALHEVVRLKSYLYLSDSQATDALDRALAAPEEVLTLVASARDAGGPPLDSWFMKPYLADRLESALQTVAPTGAAEIRGEAVWAIWWLTGNGRETLQAYALSVPELGPEALNGDGSDVRDVMTYALENEPATVVRVLLEAFYSVEARDPLNVPLIQALVSHLDDPDPIGSLALAVLLREASITSLRPILPRFTNEEAPAWQVLRTNCPQRTHGLMVLAGDVDRPVATGAQEVLSYVRQYCADWSRSGGGG